ncbi:hypothetical protein [Sulfitobacter sp. 20_GPM-1509m]|uniref:hypothetical protein n=1 Tax=Sulfitobacter sp. 20_GPM-1509m TaxID=1380367 RepID=UPI000684F148|nr:hypothetical protein [Sulfitobacter sp. 20_GPM-1509m]
MKMRSFRHLPEFRCLGLAALVVSALPCAALAQAPTTDLSSNTPFSTMAIARDEGDACRVPKPPVELAETAYVRNGYRAIMRLMAAERWQKTGSCECFLETISWEEVIEQSDAFKVSDDPRRPFDVSDLRQRADAILAQRDQACVD